MSRKIRSVHPTDPGAPGQTGSDAFGLHPLVAGLAVSVLASGASYLLPERIASSGVAFVFLAGTYALCLRRTHPRPPPYYGLSLGGLLDQAPLSATRMTKATVRAFVIATLIAAVVLPPFWWGFVYWYEPTRSFDVARAFVWEGTSSPARWLFEMTLWHLLGVALAEEAFFRGYLQSSLQRRWQRDTKSVQLATWGAIFATSALFALGHLATDLHPGRLAVFFPSLLFGAVRSVSGGIGAAVILHAECNLFSQWLGQGYGIH